MNPRVKLERSQLLRLLDGYAVQVATEVGLLEFEADLHAPWQPMVQSDRTEAIIEHHRRYGQPPPDEIWVNDIYDCFVMHDDHSGVTHLSIKRLDRAPIRNWRHFQQIKNEVVGEEREAVEIFPAESRLADNANQYHLWVLPDGAPLGLGFDGGMVTMRDEDVETFNRNGDRSRQEPLQEGLTIGETMQVAQDRMSEAAQGVMQRTLRGGR